MGAQATRLRTGETAGTARVKILKSSRHSKITGDFAEALVLYWLSKHGFECARVDHTGLDLIARNPHTKELMGLSVKSRSRSTGTEGTVLRIDGSEIPRLDAACKAFGCAPYFAIVVDARDLIRAWITPKEKFVELCEFKGGASIYWKMGRGRLKRYAADHSVIAFEFGTKTVNWWQPA